MVKLRNGLAAIAALGLAAAPASAATRAAQSLPPTSAQADAASPARASQPMIEAEALRGRSSAALIVGVLVLLAAIFLAGSGNAGGSDSPG